MQTYRTTGIYGAARPTFDDARFEVDHSNLYRGRNNPQIVSIDVDKNNGIFAVCRVSQQGCEGSTKEQQLRRLGLRSGTDDTPFIGLLFCYGAKLKWFATQDLDDGRVLQGQWINGSAEMHILSPEIALISSNDRLEIMRESTPRQLLDIATATLAYGPNCDGFLELWRGSRTFF